MATWKIVQLERNTADGGVVVAHWDATLVDGEYTQRSYGTASFTPDASAEGFVAYENLTEETVLGWVKAQVDVESIESSLAAGIESQKNPPVSTGMPWTIEAVPAE